jgi:hypothetical protein
MFIKPLRCQTSATPDLRWSRRSQWHSPTSSHTHPNTASHVEYQITLRQWRANCLNSQLQNAANEWVIIWYRRLWTGKAIYYILWAEHIDSWFMQSLIQVTLAGYTIQAACKYLPHVHFPHSLALTSTWLRLQRKQKYCKFFQHLSTLYHRQTYVWVSSAASSCIIVSSMNLYDESNLCVFVCSLQYVSMWQLEASCGKCNAELYLCASWNQGMDKPQVQCFRNAHRSSQHSQEQR